MELDALLLSRIQFGFVIAFHILFPAFTIGLASYIAVLEALWLKTGRDKYLTISKFWTKIFAVSFGMGVVSGIVMSYQFGTNWSRFSETTANVMGPLLGYEVLTAFFLEATFLGILLFGRNRVPRPIHFLSALMVAIGTLFSAFWILSANSWMQTPAGHEIVDGRFHVLSWIDVIFNPSFPYRFMHMVTACYLTTAFVVVGVSAWYLLRGRLGSEARTMMNMGLGLIALLAPAQILLGDMHGLNTFEHQPAKVAAMEGHWETRTGAPLILFGVPDMEAETNHFEIGIPYLGSLILTHSFDGQVQGLKAWPAADRPYVPLVFFSFRVMVGIGLIMLFVGATSLVLRWRGGLYERRWFLRLCVGCIPLGFVAVIAGWITTEVGRQPWVVYGLMRTADGVSAAVSGASVMTSLIAFFAAYSIIFSAGTYYIVRIIREGPQPGTPGDSGSPAKTAKRPLSGADAQTPVPDAAE